MNKILVKLFNNISFKHLKNCIAPHVEYLIAASVEKETKLHYTEEHIEIVFIYSIKYEVYNVFCFCIERDVNINYDAINLVVDKNNIIFIDKLFNIASNTKSKLKFRLFKSCIKFNNYRLFNMFTDKFIKNNILHVIDLVFIHNNKSALKKIIKLKIIPKIELIKYCFDNNNPDLLDYINKIDDCYFKDSKTIKKILSSDYNNNDTKNSDSDYNDETFIVFLEKKSSFVRKEFKKLFHHVLYYSSIEMMINYFKTYPSHILCITITDFFHFIFEGDVEKIRWILNNNVIFNLNGIDIITNGILNIISDEFIFRPCKIRNNRNYIECINIITEIGFQIPDNSVWSALCVAGAETANYLDQLGTVWNIDEQYLFALFFNFKFESNCFFDCIKWLFIIKADKWKDFDILKFDNSFDLTNEFNYLIQFNDIESISLLMSLGFQVNSYYIQQSIEFGNLNMLKLFIENTSLNLELIISEINLTFKIDITCMKVKNTFIDINKKAKLLETQIDCLKYIATKIDINKLLITELQCYNVIYYNAEIIEVLLDLGVKFNKKIIKEMFNLCDGDITYLLIKRGFTTKLLKKDICSIYDKIDIPFLELIVNKNLIKRTDISKFIINLFTHKHSCNNIGEFQIKILNWVKRNNLKFTIDQFYLIAKKGNLKFIKWFYKSGTTLGVNLFSKVLLSYNLESCIYLKNKLECHIEKQTVLRAIRISLSNQLEFLLKVKFKLREIYTLEASKYEKLYMFKLLVKYKCPFNKKECLSVIRTKKIKNKFYKYIKTLN